MAPASLPSPVPMRFTPADYNRREAQTPPLGRPSLGNTSIILLCWSRSVLCLEPRIGPVVPRPPPDSGFRGGFVPAEFKPRERRREEGERREAMPRPVGVEDAALLRQFLVSPNSAEGVEGSSSGTGDNYNPPQQPAAAAEQLRHLLMGRGLQNESKRDDNNNSRGNLNPNQDLTNGNYDFLSCFEKLLAQQGLIPPSRDSLMQMVLSQHQGPTNGLHCSIESLPSQCKAVMSEEERIRQVTNNLSNQDLQQSFEAGMLDQMKQRVSGSPKANNEENDNRQIHAQDQLRVQASNDQQNHVLTPDHQSAVPFYGGIPNGYILVPFRSGGRDSNDERKDTN